MDPIPENGSERDTERQIEADAREQIMIAFEAAVEESRGRTLLYYDFCVKVWSYLSPETTLRDVTQVVKE